MPADEAVTGSTVLVIDDEPQMLRVLAVTLAAMGYRTEVAARGSDGLAAAARQPPDTVIVDLNLPDITGFEVIRQLRTWSRSAIIVLSGSTNSEDKVLALDAGADDFVAKPFEMPELLARMRAVSRRVAKAAGASKVRVGPWTIDLAAHAVSGPDGEVSLTPAEWRVLEAMATKPGRLVTLDELLGALSGRSHVPDSSYLRMHMMHLRQKLEPEPARPRHFITEPGMGYRLLP